jgi:hypothetical protein
MLIKLCNNLSCKNCFNNSFASHPKSIYWSNENDVTPREIFISMDKKKFIFNCDKCNHKLFITAKDISSKGHWCSYCSHQKLCDNFDCQMCFNSSFASVDKCKYLNDKTINPRNLFKSTNKKFKFDCDLCKRTFETQLCDITKGVWCSYCVNKTEQLLFDKLSPNFFVI